MENLEKIRKLGKGSFGNVHLVKDKRTGEFFALKKVMQDPHNSKLNPINEAKLMTSLDNCNIIKCSRFFLQNEKLYILMEFADDGDLDKMVKEARKGLQPLPEKSILSWFTQICLALKYLHDRNVLHRDIKLQNILLMKSGLVKLGDFGISKRLENANELAQTSLGTPYYLSPELCSAQPYGRKTDVWMLGCLLYELCALERPFSGENISVLMAKILKEEPKPISPAYSPVIHRLLTSLLAKNQQKRPEIEEILQIKEIRLEIKALVVKYPQLYKSLEETYCKDINDPSSNFLPKPDPQKKKSLVKPLSYSNLPGLEQLKDESNEKFSTPHNQKPVDPNAKNSILNVINRQAKKLTLFKSHEEPGFDTELKTPQNSRVSFEQYLTHKLTTDDPKSSPLKRETLRDEQRFDFKKHPQNLDIIEEKVGAMKIEEEEKRNNGLQNNGKVIISPTNNFKPKKNSPKAFDILPASSEISSQRSRLFVEFLKERLGEEKFGKVKALLQSEEVQTSSTGLIEKKRNEILEIIGIKNVEVLKYLGILCNCSEGGERRKATEIYEHREENRVERTSSGYGKLDGFHTRK